MTDLELIIACLAIIAVGVGLFFLTGFITVRKGWIAIVEKLGIYVGTYTKRFNYFLPLLYRRVGMYPLSALTKPISINSSKYQITYQIIDAKSYHYSGHDIEKTLNASGIQTLVLNEKQIGDALAAIGCRVIAIKGE